ncbi:uncharacterized protein A4U43_C04F4720 [Asparagus officinalis]|uniref:Uncharacterized protein n=1 Tax=Asparagus officinalis TaxID=4686 RepID=A0A5P1F3R3_ASPOF|nr:uncharacterized protein LOC109836625 [Asparagus officinalis]XP_020260172.1 uncharacterized protein LOC109836625 [Asparagus officinalis]XP_020260173.1 uncharacterized protein LOC109836625 [Asparagus officinalis]XP_020260175.1 uncharacterized protein LOC109836625 [Asparagus officinalis]XP_020260176.1 uncharacterized protein LOC109836625 [Asparagus officinalis]XP_020260177.1 uncharacterized protein LOC109836625 [Asparagus officinalis]XP_020260178.1 uncharacterized protein LOC109836625 [Aspara
MTEVVTDANAGNRRRLPSWMLQVKSGDEQRKSAGKDAKCSRPEEETKSPAARSKIKPDQKIRYKTLTQESPQQSDSLQGCEVRRRTKKTTRKDDGPSTSLTVCSGAKRKIKRKILETSVNESTAATKKHVKSKRLKNSELEVVSPGRSDKEISLTVEDLLTIAEEYVAADKEQQNELLASRECTSETNPSNLSISSKAIKGRALQAGESSHILSRCTSTNHSSRLSENEEKEGENHKSGNFSGNIISTGDTAQDMLNLYLGPFMMKSPSKEQSIQKIEPKRLVSAQTIESKRWTSAQTIDSNRLPSIQEIEAKELPSIWAIESKTLPSIYELNEQLTSHEFSKEEAPLMKKKSSLKDKVAMFFDQSDKF